MAKLTITILIPTYNRPHKLEKCLERVHKQIRIPDEVMVVVRKDDFSSIEVVNQYCKKMHYLKMAYTQGEGVISAENSGLKLICNDLVVFIDDDGYAPPDWLSKIENFFLKHPDASAVGGSDIILAEPWSYYDYPVDKVGAISWFGKIEGNHHRKAKGELRQVQVLKGVNMAFRRKDILLLDENLAGNDSRLGNGSQWELDLCLSVANNGGTIYFMPDLVVEHDSDHRNHDHIVAAKNNTHNLCYVMLKNLSFFKKIAFVVYAVFIGNSQLPGILKIIVDLFKEPRAYTCRIYISKVLGFSQGLSSYIRYKIS